MDDVQQLVRNLIAMDELLRDAERVTMRLVMTPDRMVVAEAMRTFTYLNLYGYLCDAVVVNRVFPEDVGDLLRRLARGAGASSSRTSSPVRARAGAARALLRAGGARRRPCSTGSPTPCSRAATRRRCCTTG